MHVLYINLDRSPERRARIEKNLTKFGLSFSRVRAVDAQELSDDEIDAYYDATDNPYRYFAVLKKGEIGCFLSHRKALRQFLDSSEDQYVVILEDDAEFIDDPEPVFRTIQTNLNSSTEAFVIKLFSRRKNKMDRILDISAAATIGLPRICPLNTSAQIFNRTAATRFLEATKRIYLPIDVALQFAEDMEITVLQIQPNLVRGIDAEVGGLQ